MAEINDLIESLDRYQSDGVPTGDCLRALLANDLMDFIKRADPETLGNLLFLARHVYNHMDLRCWGSHAKVDAWILKKRKEREAAAAARDLEVR